MFIKGQKLKITDTADKRKPKIFKGTVQAITKHFILVKSKRYRECFMLTDFTTGRYVYE